MKLIASRVLLVSCATIQDWQTIQAQLVRPDITALVVSADFYTFPYSSSVII